jgi:MFS family permease
MALLINLLVAGLIAFVVYGLTWLAGESTAKQWIFLGVGVYAVFCWAAALRSRDLPTFRLIWGSPAFLCTTLGYGMVSFTAYAASFFGAPYAERVFGVDKADLGWLVGAPAAVAGFIGVIIGGRMADLLQQRYGNGRVMVVLFGLLAPVAPLIGAYTVDTMTQFVILNFVTLMLSSSALGAAAAASQQLVLPRMRGTATATFFLATTLVGLALGPFMAGYVSAVNGDDLALGVMSTLISVPIGTGLLIAALRLVPRAAETVIQRAAAAGEQL